mgnify:CR=1 FL=1
MDYSQIGGKIYVRVDRNEEILSSVLTVCTSRQVRSATFHGIGACGDVTTATYIPENDAFTNHQKKGMLEMVSLEGNVTHDDKGQLFQHAHAMFSYLDGDKTAFFGGHLIGATVLYTAEIVIEPIEGDGIGRMTDPVTGITVWRLS